MIATIDDHAREILRQGFGNRTTVGFAEAAKLLNIDRKSLYRLVESGQVSYRNIGNGRRRIRRRFTVGDLESFIAGAATRTAHATGVRPRANVRVRRADAGAGSFLASFATETTEEKKQ